MCIVVDPPSLVPMFKPADPAHVELKPLFDWIDSGPGKLVVGGTKYGEELRAVKSVIPLLAELERRRKVVRASMDEVDRDVAVLVQIEPSKDFDDPHLVALVRVTGCRLVCLRDPRAHRFLRASRLYRRPSERPKLFTRAKNSHLLCNDYFAPCCRQ